MRHRELIIVGLLIASIIANILLFVLLQQHNQQTIVALHKKYPLLSNRALNRDYPNNLIVNFLPLREQVNKIVTSYSDSFALYFEYLPTGTTIGINEDKEFTAESLLKVPVVMAYFHKKEQLGMTKDPIVTIQSKELNSKYGDLYKKGVGYSITLGDAVALALQKSDNTASLVIADQISSSDFNFVYDGLDIPETLDKNLPIITAQEYASILKALYFGSVLTNDDSEKILTLLTHTDFNSLLPSGVPAGIPVAHKIGLVNQQIYEDCGIVYLPQRPYILCMVSHSDAQMAQQRMQTLSHAVYTYVSSLPNVN